MATDKVLYRDWEIFKKDLLAEATLEYETEEDQAKRIKKLEANPEDWFRYYFPNYYTAEPANFHKKSTKRVLNNRRLYMVKAWSRELAKSVRTMMEVLFIAYATEEQANTLLISSDKDSADELLEPYRINIEHNPRLKNDYGTQAMPGKWQRGNFKMRNRSTFLGVGAGQNPRGSREEEIRPTIIIFDDIDTDEQVRNEEQIDKKWQWIEKAVIPTVSVSGDIRIIFCGNIIAKDTCITRAIKQADYVEIVNIRDETGKSTWPQKNSEKHIDWILSKISWASQQGEYFNNPIKSGTVFKEITWGKIPRIDSFKYLIKYGDPSYSNKTKKQNSNKCVVLMGKKNDKFYVITCRLDKATNSDFVKWYNSIDEGYKHDKVQLYNWVENNSLQDPFFEQVLKPEFVKQKIKIKGDGRKKPEKFFRVEGNLEPLNREGNLIFNINEKDNPHMKRMEEHFIDFSEATAKVLDGPDAVEGGHYILENKREKLKPEDVSSFNYKNKKSKHKY